MDKSCSQIRCCQRHSIADCNDDLGLSKGSCLDKDGRKMNEENICTFLFATSLFFCRSPLFISQIPLTHKRKDCYCDCRHLQHLLLQRPCLLHQTKGITFRGAGQKWGAGFGQYSNTATSVHTRRQGILKGTKAVRLQR